MPLKTPRSRAFQCGKRLPVRGVQKTRPSHPGATVHSEFVERSLAFRRPLEAKEFERPGHGAASKTGWPTGRPGSRRRVGVQDKSAFWVLYRPFQAMQQDIGRAGHINSDPWADCSRPYRPRSAVRSSDCHRNTWNEPQLRCHALNELLRPCHSRPRPAQTSQGRIRTAALVAQTSDVFRRRIDPCRRRASRPSRPRLSASPPRSL